MYGVLEIKQLVWFLFSLNTINWINFWNAAPLLKNREPPFLLIKFYCIPLYYFSLAWAKSTNFY